MADTAAFPADPVATDDISEQNTTVGDITGGAASEGSQDSAGRTSEHLGAQPTPPLVVRNMTMAAFEEGYDSDGYREPFHTTYERLRKLSHEEEAVASANPNDLEGGSASMGETTTDPESVGQCPAPQDEAATFNSSDAHIKSLKVSELQEVCKLLGLGKKGKKKDLQDRLMNARDNGATYLTAIEVTKDAG